MKRTHVLLTAFVLTVSGVCLSWQQRLAVPKPTHLRITVTDEGHNEVRDATVELQDYLGGSSAMDQRNTDPNGRAEFDTVTGLHRVRITGADIQTYEGEIDIALTETYHNEPIRVRRNARGGQPATAEALGYVPAVRLKIPDNARKEFERGSKSLADKDWKSARKSFQAAIDLYPDYDLAYNGLGVASSQLQDVPAARQAFRKAVDLNDKFAGAERNLARITLSERNYQETAVLLNQSLAVEPGDAWALTNAAYAELQLHRFKEAADHAVRVHALPHDGLANAHVIAAYALDALGQHQEAIAQWKQYLQEAPKGPNARRAEDELRRLTKAPQS
ncbi:MAG TPA: tetratricopeptide repeat protein [Terriglobales bacterium]|nr:tetratricopeptide repeat protein [Terriglobales bacterium]